MSGPIVESERPDAGSRMSERRSLVFPQVSKRSSKETMAEGCRGRRKETFSFYLSLKYFKWPQFQSTEERQDEGTERGTVPKWRQ
jgi:hypothetical protein